MTSKKFNHCNMSCLKQNLRAIHTGNFCCDLGSDFYCDSYGDFMARQTHACEHPAISLRFQKYALLRYCNCFEHVQISLRFSRDPPREICLRFRQVKMAAKNMNQGPKTHTHTKKRCGKVKRKKF